MRFLRRSLVGLFLVALTLGLLAFGGQMLWGALQDRWSQEQRPRAARERVFAVNVVTAQTGAQRPTLRTFGEVRSRRTLEIRAPLGGRIVALADGFVDGGTVDEGQLLLRIDPSTAQSSRDVALTDVQEAEAEVRDAERGLQLAKDERDVSQAQADLRAQALQRQRDLSSRGVGTAAAVEVAELAAASANQAVVSRRQAVAQAEARVDQARTALDRQRIKLSESERQLAESEVRADFSGVLSDVSLVEGGLIGVNEHLADLIDPDRLEVSFRLSTVQYARLLDENGSLLDAPVEAVMDLDGSELIATGRVSRVSAAVGEGQTGRLLFAQLQEAAGFRPGDFVTVRVTEPELTNVTVLPASALDAGNTVLVLDAEDRLGVRQVDLLRRQGDAVLVRGTDLAGNTLDGAEIVAERSPLLGAGIKVRPLRQDRSAGGGAGGGDTATGPTARNDTAMPEGPELVALSPERRQRLIDFVQSNDRMPGDVKKRLLAQLAEDRVPAQTVDRLEQRMGG